MPRTRCCRHARRWPRLRPPAPSSASFCCSPSVAPGSRAPIPKLPSRIFPMTDVQNDKPASKRRFWFMILGGVVLVGALVYGVYWLLYSRYFESTDDAYVAGNVVTITSKENATVLALHADNTQTVKQGQL